MTKFPLLAATALLSLTACATLFDHSSQPVNFQAAGATEVACDVTYAGLKYHVRPPQTIIVQKSREDMRLSCQAAGNRVKTMVVPSSVSGWTFANVGNGVVPGAAYDAETGAMFKYPDVILIDFSDTTARMDTLPAYHAVDTLDPSIASTEDLSPNLVKLPGDDATALRHKMARMQHDQEEAENTERESRKAALEGGWDGDKGYSAPAAQPPVAPDDLY
jgi:hypothetical protein